MHWRKLTSQPDYYSSQANLAAASQRGPFIQAMYDVGAVLYWAGFVSLAAFCVCLPALIFGWVLFLD